MRILRIARLFRLLKLRSLNTMARALVLSLPAIWNIGFLLAIFIFSFAVPANRLFGEVAHSPGGLSSAVNFETVGMACLTLFQMTTGSNWAAVANGCGVTDPTYCGTDGQGKCGSMGISRVFFTVFMVVGNMVVPYLFCAAMLENFFDSTGKAREGRHHAQGRRLENAHDPCCCRVPGASCFCIRASV